MHSHDITGALLRTLDAPRRNHFFYGKRMDVQHFEMEQNYGKLKQWLLNRLTLGKGVLCGLRVWVDGDRICVDPGAAIDGLGREILVPIRACIDPLARDDGCCGNHGTDSNTGTGSSDGPAAERPTDGIFTLWLCYRECLADQQPVLVSDCDSRDHCAAGTVVETFCLKVTTGLPPLQGDPEWCAQLWPKKQGDDTDAPRGDRQPSDTLSHLPAAGDENTRALHLTPADIEAIREAAQSRRHILCELFDEACDVPKGDPCVPLAIVVLRDGKLFTESCLVRPRIYSNARLLDLILCLGDKIDECCNKHEPAELMRVRNVDFLNRTAGAPESVVASVQTPLQDTPVDINRNANAIRIRFSKPFAQDQNIPTTAGLNDPDFKRHNVQILASQSLNNLPYVPGSLAIETPDTVRFDPSPESPYLRPGGGWQKGRYVIFLRGTENLPSNQRALADLTDTAFDGEPIAPAAGLMSGNGTPGGDFNAVFVVGGEAPPQETLRVRSVEFLNRSNAGERTITRVDSPLDTVTLTTQAGLNAIRIRLSRAFAQDAHIPTTHPADDPDFQSHNVQVRIVVRRGQPSFVPGDLQIDAPDTVTFLLNIPVPPTRGPLPWPAGSFRLFLRGADDAANQHPAITDTAGRALDGEPAAPANGVISGDGVDGGDFTLDFIVRAVD
jgi:hypothetical protein